MSVCVFIAMAVLAKSELAANAQEKTADTIKQRIDTMTAMGKDLNTILKMIKGEIRFDVTAIVETADHLFNKSLLAAKQFPDPVDTEHATASRALPGIWNKKGEFDRLFGDLLDQSEMLAQIAARDDINIIRVQFAETIEICSACHEKFRRPKQ